MFSSAAENSPFQFHTLSEEYVMKKKRKSVGKPAMTKEQIAFYEAYTKDFLRRLFKGDVKRELIAEGLYEETQPLDVSELTAKQRKRNQTRTKRFLDRLFSGKIAEDLLAKRVLEELLPRERKAKRKTPNAKRKK